MADALFLRGAIALLVLFGLTACGQKSSQAPFRYSGLAMGTSFTIKAARLPKRLNQEELKDSLDEVILAVDRAMSTYRRDSELSRFNQAHTTAWIPVSEDLVAVVAEALAVSRWSEGAFDVTVGPLVNLWGFGPDPRARRTPEAGLIAAAMKRVGYQKLEVRRAPPALAKHRPDLYVDLSSIAKGFAVDKVAETLETQGIHDYMVEIGGELRLSGQTHRGGPWRIAIERPVAEVREVETVLSLTDIAMATSGDYRNYFEAEGQRFSHTIDPRTGRPIAHRLASVTVLSHTTMHADALATAFMVLGPTEGFAKAEQEGVRALFIIKQEKGFIERPTSAFLRYIQGGAS